MMMMPPVALRSSNLCLLDCAAVVCRLCWESSLTSCVFKPHGSLLMNNVWGEKDFKRPEVGWPDVLFCLFSDYFFRELRLHVEIKS